VGAPRRYFTAPGSDPAELKASAEKHFRGPVTVGEDLLEV
jgi:hypothetical protein